MHPSADLSTAVWRRSSKSTAQGNECVEIAAAASLISVRDSKHPAGPIVTMEGSAFALLAQEIRRGQHDL